MVPYYSEAGIEIYHGDCREILRQLPPVDLVLTDPPYGLKRIRGGSGLRSGQGRWAKHFMVGVDWDDAPSSETIIAVLEAASGSIIWGAQFYCLPPARGWLVWNKIIRNWSSSECELAWTSLDQANKAFDYSHGQLAIEGKHYHAAQKPLPLMKWCLGFAPDAQTILDPFMGSGTTLRAAKDLGRKAIGIEIEERYCEVAANRLRQEVLQFA